MKSIKVLSVNISEKKGTIKRPVKFIKLLATGVENDAHSGLWHRQVSLLGNESIQKFSEQAGRQISFGEFAENITTEGLLLYECNPLDRFICGEIILEVTQIGKECHGNSCNIFKEVGNCVMPKEGIFCRVISGGLLKAGDMLEYHPKVFKTEIITLSDRASHGIYSDRSGPKITEILNNHFQQSGKSVVINNTIIPDNPQKLRDLISKSVENNTDIIITTGGTGISRKDITVDTVIPLLDKEIPGLMDFIRYKYGVAKPNALISRSVAGISGNTFIFTLPGSVRAVEEYLSEITKVLDHLFMMFYEIDSH